MFFLCNQTISNLIIALLLFLILNTAVSTSGFLYHASIYQPSKDLPLKVTIHPTIIPRHTTPLANAIHAVPTPAPNEMDVVAPPKPAKEISSQTHQTPTPFEAGAISTQTLQSWKRNITKLPRSKIFPRFAWENTRWRRGITPPFRHRMPRPRHCTFASFV